MYWNRTFVLMGSAALFAIAAPQFFEQRVQRGLVYDGDSWRRADVVDADSAQASDYEGAEQVDVRLPDASSASMVLDHKGRPRALILPTSNTLAARRERVLEAGATITVDQQLVLPATTDQGQRVEFVIDPDGRTRASSAESAYSALK